MQEKISPSISWHNMFTWRYNFQICEESSNHDILNDRKPLKIVLTEEKLDDISH
jgi:hypothetical protein